MQHPVPRMAPFRGSRSRPRTRSDCPIRNAYDQPAGGGGEGSIDRSDDFTFIPSSDRRRHHPEET
jgi:hypothetical protein